jgi:rubrerythrin
MIVSSEDPVVELVKKQKRAEEAMAKVVEALEGKVHNEAAKLLLTELRLDSTKHARICEQILKIAEKTKPDRLWDARIDSYVDMQVMKKELEKHVKAEDDMLKDVEKVIASTKDEALKLMFTHIAEDEKKHHKNVELVIKKSYMLSP